MEHTHDLMVEIEENNTSRLKNQVIEVLESKKLVVSR